MQLTRFPPQEVQIDDRPLMFEKSSIENKEQYTYEEFIELDKRILSYTKEVENFNILTWDESHKYEQITLEKTKSVFLDNNEEYQSMRAMIELFNQELSRAQQSKSKLRNGIWRWKFYKGLCRILYEIEFFTQSRALQLEYIQRSYQWALEIITKVDYQGKRKDDDDTASEMRPFSSKTRPYSSVKRPYSSITTKSGRPQSGYPNTIIDGYAETTIDQSQADRPESAAIKIQDLIQKELTAQKSQMPSDFVKQQLLDYETQARTKHEGYQQPQVALKQYKRRIIQNVDITRPATAMPKAQQKVKVFTKPPKSAIPIVQEVQQEEVQNQSQEEIVNEILDDNNQEQLVDIVPLTQQMKEVEAKKRMGFLDPKIKVFRNDDQLTDNFKRTLDFECKDNYQQYKTSNNNAELRMQQLYQKNRNYEAKSKREDEEMVMKMKQWGQNKGRLEKEINRRIESASYGNKFRQLEISERPDKQSELKEINKLQQKHQKALIQSQAEHDLELSDLSESEEAMIIQQQLIAVDNETGMIEGQEEQIKRRPYSAAPIRNQVMDFSSKIPKVEYNHRFVNDTEYRGLELQITKQRINRTKELNGQLLGLVPPEDESNKLPPEHSMSMYSKNSKYTKAYRPLSAALASMPLDQQRADELKEIEEIKLRLAKHKIDVPVRKLVNALMMPNPINMEDLAGINIPQPGFGILSDPFAKKKKKKGSKGRKKAKK